MVCFDGETFGCVCETCLQRSSAASLNPPSREPWKDAEQVEFRNIPQARVSPAGSKSRRRPFLYQSGVFAHFPLSCRLNLRHSCKENRLHICPVQRLLNLQLFLSSGPTGGPGFRPRGSARRRAKTKGRLRVWGANKTDTNQTENTSDSSLLLLDAGKSMEECCRVCAQESQASPNKAAELWSRSKKQKLLSLKTRSLLYSL